MNKTIKLAASAAILAAVTLWAQEEGQAGKQALQGRIAELKESIAANRAKLQKYEWVETTEVSLRGEVRKREQKQCRYGPDGKVQKTPTGDSAGEMKRQQRGGLRGRIVEKKVDELKDYMERVESLVREYVPPDPEKIQASFQAGKAKLDPGSGGTASMTLSDYAKPGDKVTFAFNRAAKKLQTYTVNTYLDSPQDLVTLTADFSTLPDGANHVAHSILNATGKQIQVNTTNSNYKLVGSEGPLANCRDLVAFANSAVIGGGSAVKNRTEERTA